MATGTDFWVRLAGYPLWLASPHAYTVGLFRDYRLDPSPADRALFGALCRAAGREEGPLRPGPADGAPVPAGVDCPLEVLESLALYRTICDLLLRQDVLLFHSSAVALDGKAYLFAAPSGTGKSTHARLWKARFGDRLTLLNDDKPLLRFEPAGQVLACGTPYAGKEDLHANRMAPVAGILVLRQSPVNTIRPLTAAQALPVYYQQCYRGLRDPDLIHRSLDLMGRLTRLPVYELGCTISLEAVDLAWNTLRGATKP